jgi:hypothetical protein
MTDRGREAVYAAEVAAFDGTSYERCTDLGALQGLAREITGAAWWSGGPIAVIAARRDASSSATYWPDGSSPVIRLAATQMTPATLTHEMAHALAGVANGHGPAFRRAHTDLVNFVFGTEPAGWLVDAYQAMGLTLGDRQWQPPSAHAIV